jgi:phosphoserine phosphatase
LGGQDLLWLGHNEAVCFNVEKQRNEFSSVWAELQLLKIDMVIRKKENHFKSLLLADMDSTMIEQECIDELADMYGVGSKVRKITTRAMNGELGFQDALNERVALLAQALVSTMKSNGAYTALVSGGFTAFSNPVSEILGFDEHHANILVEENGIFTGQVADPILGRNEKVNRLNLLVQDRGLSHKDVLAVGDGANDLGVLELAGMGVAMHAKPIVAEKCDIVINHCDLTSLLYLQGYRKEDFVETEINH